jgi:hypothetical protein
LSADAFSKFQEDSQQVYNDDIVEATFHLRQIVIPDFAKKLEKRSEEKSDITPESICQKMHIAGVNLRYLGIVR